MTSAVYLKVGAGDLAGDTSAPMLADFVKPDVVNSADLIGLYVFSNSETRSLINHADPTKPLTIVGNPVFERDGVVVSRANCLDTGLLATSAMTLVVLFEDAGGLRADGGSLISSLTLAAQAGTTFNRGDDISISPNGDGVVRFFRDRGGAANVAGISGTLTMPSDGSHACIVATVNADNLADAATGKAGATQFVAQSAGTGANSRTLWTRTLRFGSSYDDAVVVRQASGKMRIKAAAIYDAANNSNAQLAAIVESLRTFAATVGLTF